MKHLKSNKQGNQAEINLMSMVKNDKNKHRYVSAKLSNFSFTLFKIIDFNKSDRKLMKYLMNMHKNHHMATIYDSNLTTKQQNHLRNAIKTRYMTLIRSMALELN